MGHALGLRHLYEDNHDINKNKAFEKYLKDKFNKKKKIIYNVLKYYRYKIITIKIK